MPAAQHTGVEDGVGLTALMVAAARAIETHRPDALARDTYAEHFVRAAEASAAWPVRPAEVPDGDANPLWGRLGRYFGLRTRVFDDFLVRPAHAGVRQVVLLGAGLDTRAFRLGWSPDHTVYEIDRDGVLAFKHDVLDGLAAVPTATRRPIAVDLSGDWVASLVSAGFDPAAPAAWLAEGLLLYLPSAAERRLIDTVDRLSADGSSMAFEVKLGTESPEVRASPVYAATRQQIGVDLLALFDGEPRPDSVASLKARGWSTAVATPFDFARHLGRGPLPEPDDALASNRWVFAYKPADR
ncbi:SAM-dependent methyltransferase [Microtetraspora fusca]|uniref:SAM-dependent methyltransferase n=1 Tax=Microtetraspora fusca TaxID=1997 RepID=UPI0008339472|nr:SAM-dependent methyltransferase [Microtetraspora fusca]